MVNVDDAALHGAADLVGEDLHVARQDDELNVFGGDQVEELALRLGLRVLRDGDIEEGDAVELGNGRQVRVIADDRDDVDGHALRLLAVQEVSEAVALTGDHDDGAQLAAQVVDAVHGGEFLGDAGQALIDGRAPLRGVDLDAHEEGTRVGVAELLGLDDVAAGPTNHAGHGVHDTGAVRAGQGHNKLRVFSHGSQSSQVHTHERGRGTVCGRRHGVAGWGCCWARLRWCVVAVGVAGWAGCATVSRAFHGLPGPAALVSRAFHTRLVCSKMTVNSRPGQLRSAPADARLARRPTRWPSMRTLTP